ncbi:MAG: hypothetical protein LBJ10_01520, partial [Clostridiales bacterium]|nr:hypothetical protein [Clostridiales bacterium]
MGNRYRTHNCGELRKAHVGEKVRLAGWLDAVRDHGGVVFFDLRDQYGVTQAVLHDGGMLAGIGRESALSVSGVVALRDQDTVNAAIGTGEVELRVDGYGGAGLPGAGDMDSAAEPSGAEAGAGSAGSADAEGRAAGGPSGGAQENSEAGVGETAVGSEQGSGKAAGREQGSGKTAVSAGEPPRGAVELLGAAPPELPFQVRESHRTREDLRLKYRYLDLRNPQMHKKIAFRAKVIGHMRRLMDERGFMEIQTPILTASSPEG